MDIRLKNKVRYLIFLNFQPLPSGLLCSHCQRRPYRKGVKFEAVKIEIKFVKTQRYNFAFVSYAHYWPFLAFFGVSNGVFQCKTGYRSPLMTWIQEFPQNVQQYYSHYSFPLVCFLQKSLIVCLLKFSSVLFTNYSSCHCVLNLIFTHLWWPL